MSKWFFYYQRYMVHLGVFLGGPFQLLASGSMARAREQGLVRTEGKEYVVKDGDVIEFKI